MGNEDNRQYEGETFITPSTKIGIIGLGNIGKAMATGMLNSGFLEDGQLYLSNGTLERTQTRCGEEIVSRREVVITNNNLELIQSSDIVFLALKQKHLKDELNSLSANEIDRNKLFVSLAAGIRINTIKKWLSNTHQPVVRVMPNTPVSVGKGVFGWAVSDEVTVGQIKLLKELFNSLGTEILVDNDEQIDSVTAISGSGPAYFLYLAERLEQFALDKGFSPAQSQLIVTGTFDGSALMQMKTNIDYKTLRQNITSPGGTTAAAIQSFNQNNLDEILSRGFNAAKNKASELADEFDLL